MSRLPIPGEDAGNWGEILNDFLEQSHNGDGGIKESAIPKSTNVTADGSSDTKVPSVKAVKTYTDGKIDEVNTGLDSKVAMPTDNIGNIFDQRLTLVEGRYIWSNNGVITTDIHADYAYFTVALEKNIDYCCTSARHLVLVDNSETVLQYKQNQFIFNSGEATKAYISFSKVQYPIVNYAFCRGVIMTQDKKYKLGWLETRETYLSKKLNLPTPIYGVVGKTIKIYWTGLPFATSGYDIDVTCTKGINYTDRWEYTPSTAETFSIAIAIYKDGEKVAEGSSTVIIVAVGTTSQSAKVLIIGDSTVASGYLGQRILDDCASDGHLSITLLGTLGSAPNLHEGRNGWAISSYATQPSYLSINNPFYHNGTFDFAYYLSTYSIDEPDYVLIQLGINDMFDLTNDAQVNSTIDIVLPRLAIMIDSIKSAVSNTKIGFNITIPPNSSQNAYGAALGCG